METLRENYPPSAFYSAMNFLGTHDTVRILTALGAAHTPGSKGERAEYRLSPAEYRRGTELLRVGAALLYTFPGSPTVYYGDECGAQGFEDPFCRQTFPWGKEDVSLQTWFAMLGGLRNRRASLRKGTLRWHYAHGGGIVYSRALGDEITLVALNAGDSPLTLSPDWEHGPVRDVFTGEDVLPAGGKLAFTVPPRTARIFTV
jgi:4-alpha-glucanotransferase